MDKAEYDVRLARNGVLVLSGVVDPGSYGFRVTVREPRLGPSVTLVATAQDAVAMVQVGLDAGATSVEIEPVYAVRRATPIGARS